MQNNQVAEPLKSIINTFANYGQPAAVDRAKALFESVLEEHYYAAVKAVGMAAAAYSQASGLAEVEAAYERILVADSELDDARRMMQAHQTRVPYPKYKGD